MGATREMLHDQDLPMHLWVEACKIVVFVQSCCPHRILGMSTFEEDFTSKKLDVSHFRIFGSFAYVH